MGPATARAVPRSSASPTCASAWRALLRFAVWTALISVAFSLLALPWVHLPWWRVVRRCVSIASAISLWICVCRHERRSFSSYGLTVWRDGRRHFLLGIGLGLALLALLFGIELALGWMTVELTPDRAKLWRTVITFVPAAALVSVLEELAFRGYILQHLLACAVRPAVLISSMLYAVVHLKSMVVTAAGARELTGLCIFGIILCISYLRTGRLWLAIGLHTVLAYGARVNKLVFHRDETALVWLTGTNRLVDGLAGWIGLAVLGALVWRLTKSEDWGGKHAG